MVEGIGEDFLPPTSDFTRVKKGYATGDKESFLTARLLLEKEGLTVRSAGTIREAGALWASETPDVALVDLGLPDGNGLDLVERFTAENPQVRVIIMTASDRRDLHEQVSKSGAFSLLQKPYSFRDVLAEVQKALQKG